jgi:hypothetical protein
MQIPQRMRFKFLSSVRVGISGMRRSKLRLPVLALLEWWRYSNARLVVGEIRRFHLRMRAIREDTTLRFGAKIPLTLWDRDRVTLYPVNSFLRACSDDIQRLQTQFPWCGALEFQMLGQAFQNGARWASRNCDNGSDNEDTVQP